VAGTGFPPGAAERCRRRAKLLRSSSRAT